MLLQQSLENRRFVIPVIVLTTAQESLDHGIVLGDKFEDEIGPERSQPREQFGQRDAASNHEMMQQGQTEYQFGATTFGERSSLCAAPP